MRCLRIPSETDFEAAMNLQLGADISRATTDLQISEFFTRFGTAVAVDRPLGHDVKARGFAFVTFDKPETVQRVLASTTRTDGRVEFRPRHIRVTQATERVHKPTFEEEFMAGANRILASMDRATAERETEAEACEAEDDEWKCKVETRKTEFDLSLSRYRFM